MSLLIPVNRVVLVDECAIAVEKCPYKKQILHVEIVQPCLYCVPITTRKFDFHLTFTREPALPSRDVTVYQGEAASLIIVLQYGLLEFEE